MLHPASVKRSVHIPSRRTRCVYCFINLDLLLGSSSGLCQMLVFINTFLTTTRLPTSNSTKNGPVLNVKVISRIFGWSTGEGAERYIGPREQHHATGHSLYTPWRACTGRLAGRSYWA